MGRGLGCEQLGPASQKSQGTFQEPEIQGWQSCEIWEQGWQRYIHELAEGSTEVAHASFGLLKDQGGQEARGGTTKDGEYKAEWRTISRGPGSIDGPTIKLPGWTPTGGTIEGRQIEEVDYNGPEEIHWTTHQSEERPGLDEGGACQAQRGMDKTRAGPSGEHEGSVAAIPVGTDEFRCLRSRIGAELRLSKTCHSGYYAADYASGGGRQGHCGAGFSFVGWRTGCTHRGRGRERSEGGDTGHGYGRCLEVANHIGRMCELAQLCNGTSKIQITKTKSESGGYQRRYNEGFMIRRGGSCLAWQSVSTEQDQTRFLRFVKDVEVWEFEVGYDTDYGRYNVYEHYEFSWRPLNIAKSIWDGCRRLCMNTFEALLHGYNHSVRSQEDFVDQ